MVYLKYEDGLLSKIICKMGMKNFNKEPPPHEVVQKCTDQHVSYTLKKNNGSVSSHHTRLWRCKLSINHRRRSAGGRRSWRQPVAVFMGKTSCHIKAAKWWKPQEVSCFLLLVALYTEASNVHVHIPALNYPTFPHSPNKLHRTRLLNTDKPATARAESGLWSSTFSWVDYTSPCFWDWQTSSRPVQDQFQTSSGPVPSVADHLSQSGILCFVTLLFCCYWQ